MIVSTVMRRTMILSIVIFVVSCSNDTTTITKISPDSESTTDETDDGSDELLTKTRLVHNITNKSIMKIPKRRTVLIVGDSENNRTPSNDALRIGGKRKKRKKKDKTVTSLLYQEYDDNKKLLNQFWMYSLADVSIFFEQFLETEVCYGKCVTDEDEENQNPTG